MLKYTKLYSYYSVLLLCFYLNTSPVISSTGNTIDASNYFKNKQIESVNSSFKTITVNINPFCSNLTASNIYLKSFPVQ